MAQVVRQEAMTTRKPSRVAVGQQLVEVITSGMYSDPLMVLREYVQNAVDAIDAAAESGLLSRAEGRIEIDLDGRTRTIAILDNGVGVGESAVTEVLCSLGHSTKSADRHRGFRGIGRLGGLGYCDELVFETRQAGRKRVTTVTWDCRRLRAVLRRDGDGRSASKAVRQVVTVATRRGRPGEPQHFFRVTMRDVHQFHRDELISIPVVRSYLAQVAPVAFDASRFPLAGKIESHLSGLDGYDTYDLRLNGKRVFRPHAETFAVSGTRSDRIGDVELFVVPGPHGDAIGRGWYACTGFRASIPPSVGMRGVRVRQGNIEVGDEYSLANSFSERRFAVWHIGEIHVSYALRANARRDRFEQSPACEAFLEHANRLGRHLSNLCRMSSKERSARAAEERHLRRVEELLSGSVLVDGDHFAMVRELAATTIEELHAAGASRDGHAPSFYRRLARARKDFRGFASAPPYLRAQLDGRSLRHLSKKDLLETVARRILALHAPDKSAEQLVSEVMSEYFRPASRQKRR